eukprot:COSAG01_NODE_345_length_18538_cov_64.139433_5_plen_60_part_00
MVSTIVTVIMSYYDHTTYPHPPYTSPVPLRLIMHLPQQDTPGDRSPPLCDAKCAKALEP